MNENFLSFPSFPILNSEANCLDTVKTRYVFAINLEKESFSQNMCCANN